MDIKTPAVVLLLSLILLVLAFSLLPMAKYQDQVLPWQIRLYPDGSSQVFGIHLGHSKLPQAQNILQGDGVVSLFFSQGRYSLEVYFDKVELAGLSSKMVLLLDVPQEQLKNMYHRGQRISSLSQGGKKVRLSSADRRHIEIYPIYGITYLPAVRLQRDQITKRFGPADSELSENNHSIVHQLYPKLGLDVILEQDKKSVIQYISPRDFTKLLRNINASH